MKIWMIQRIEDVQTLFQFVDYEVFTSKPDIRAILAVLNTWKLDQEISASELEKLAYDTGIAQSISGNERVIITEIEALDSKTGKPIKSETVYRNQGGSLGGNQDMPSKVEEAYDGEAFGWKPRKPTKEFLHEIGG